LGVLRLISENEQYGDPQAAGSWERDVFVLCSSLFKGEPVADREALIHFFLLLATPILAPWNGEADFISKKKLKEKTP
jgi:CRISPR-associated protein Csx17